MCFTQQKLTYAGHLPIRPGEAMQSETAASGAFKGKCHFPFGNNKSPIERRGLTVAVHVHKSNLMLYRLRVLVKACVWKCKGQYQR